MAVRWQSLAVLAAITVLLGLVGVAPAMAVGGSVNGVVSDSQSVAPIPGIDVELWDWAGGLDPVATTTAGVSGDYTFVGIAPGTYEVWAGSGSYYWDSATTTFTVTADEAFTRDIALDPIPDLSGTVYDAGTNPVTGATVTAWSYDSISATYYESAWTTSDASGAYTLPDIGDGDYYLTFDAVGYYSVTYPSDGYRKFSTATPVNVGTTDVTGIDAHMTAPTGIAYIDVELWRMGDFASGHILAATVRLVAADGRVYSASPNPIHAGLATLVVPKGEYELIITAPGYIQSLRHVTIRDSSLWGFALDPIPPAIAGSVVHDDGSPAAGVSVTAYASSAGSWIAQATSVTDAAGNYTFKGLSGTYRVGVASDSRAGDGTLYGPAFWSDADTLAGAADVNTTVGDEAAGVDIVLSPVPVAVSGTIVEAASTSTPVSGATVELVVQEGAGSRVVDSTTSDVDGTYSLQAAAGTAFQIRVAKTGRVTQTVGPMTFSGTTLTQDFALATPDTTAPRITVQTVGNGTATVQLTFSATDAGGQPAISYTIDGGAPIPYVGTFIFPYTGSHTVVVTAIDPSGNKATRTLSITCRQWGTFRVGGSTRYDVAVNFAAELKSPMAFSDVVVACGEDRAMADPLGAAALAAAYDGPVLLTPTAKASASTINALKAIRDANGGKVNIHVVGGTASIPKAVYSAIAATRGSGSIERISGANRYDLTYRIAASTKAVLESKGRPVPGAIVVNIENPASFNDALAVSPISARAHMPLIGVRANSVPAEANAALALFAGKPHYALNAAYLSANVRGATGCGAVVTSSANREIAAIDIAKWGVSNGFVSYRNVGLANKLSDALPAGAVLGQKNGVMLYTGRSPLSATTATFAATLKSLVSRGWVIGGTSTIYEGTSGEFAAAIR